MNSVHYEIVESELKENTFPIYKASNVVLVNDFLTTSQLSLGEISSLLNMYVLGKLDLPKHIGKGRKLYVSRGSSAESESAYLEPGNPASGYKSNTDRLYSEPMLEEYLKSKDFEIVKSSELGSIEDQVRLFNSASVVLGATGTGLTNLLFMQDGSTVIELRTEILWSTGDHDANNHYCYLSYGKGHTYMFVDISDKQASTAITKLDKLFNALDLDAL
jgi:capsular polysaccharide biosynthesis protein